MSPFRPLAYRHIRLARNAFDRRRELLITTLRTSFRMLLVKGRFSTFSVALRVRSGLPRNHGGLEVLEDLRGEANRGFVLASLKGIFRKLQRVAHLADVPAAISGAFPSLDGPGQMVQRLGSRNGGSRLGFGGTFRPARLRTHSGGQ